MALSNQKTLGVALGVFAVALIALLAIVKVQVDEEGAFLCKLVDESPNLTMDQCPAHNNNVSWFIIAGFGVAFLIIAIAGYLFLTAGKEAAVAVAAVAVEGKQFKEVDVSAFDEEEKAVYELIRKNEGSMYQSDLVRESGYSKVRVTRILDKLESKKIVERKRRGMANIVVLS
ncbi:MarR family protein [uncultured archaeon]|nr:MarR family protein [uncultured archaeon]